MSFVVPQNGVHQKARKDILWMSNLDLRLEVWSVHRKWWFVSTAVCLRFCAHMLDTQLFSTWVDSCAFCRNHLEIWQTFLQKIQFSWITENLRCKPFGVVSFGGHQLFRAERSKVIRISPCYFCDFVSVYVTRKSCRLKDGSTLDLFLYFNSECVQMSLGDSCANAYFLSFNCAIGWEEEGIVVFIVFIFRIWVRGWEEASTESASQGTVKGRLKNPADSERISGLVANRHVSYTRKTKHLFAFRRKRRNLWRKNHHHHPRPHQSLRQSLRTRNHLQRRTWKRKRRKRWGHWGHSL